MNFYDVLAAKNWDGGIPTINFFDLLFAQFVSGEAWETYEGTLPATINANGDNMKQYQIYGATGGVGEPTENLLDESTLVKGFYDRIDGEIIINPIAKGSIVFRSFRQSLTPGTYTVSFEHNVNIVRAIVDDVISSNVAENISSYTVTTQTGDIGFSMRRTASSQTPWDNNPTMLTEGTTPPETYVPYGYEVDMATGTNILQNSEIEQDGWQAQVGTTPRKIVNPKRCRSKDIYPISGEKIFYDFKSLNINIAFVDSNGISLGGSGFKTGTGSVDAPENAAKCLFIIANTDVTANITPAQVIAAGIWASIDATITPIYIGDNPLDKDEYVDYQDGKVYRMINGTLTPTDAPAPFPALPTIDGETVVDYAGAKTETTKNILPSAQAQTLTVNGNTCTCDGQGRYHVDMNNNTDTNFAFSIPNFTIPVSVGQGGNGTWSMFNTATQSMQVKLYYNDTEIDYWSISDTNRASDSYVSMGGKTINKIIINAWNASVDGDFAFMFTDDGVLPAEFVPHEIAKPTPEKVLLEYKKG